MFFYGTLCYRPLLELVLQGQSYQAKPACLPAHKVSWVKDQPFPMIQACPNDPDAVAQGLLVEELSDTAKARLDFYEGGFDYTLQALAVHPDGQAAPVTAQVYFPDPGLWTAGDPWSLDDWVAAWGDLTLEAAREVMGTFGTLTPKQIAERFAMIRVRAASRLRARNNASPTTLRAAYGAQDVRVTAEAQPYTGFFAMKEQTLSFRRYSGEMSETVTRSAFVGGDAVIVLPYDPVRDRVMVIEQFRMGPHMRGDPSPWLLEPIAGRIDPGETPEVCAHREAQEEAGLTLDRLLPLPHHYPSPGASTEFFYTYVALCDLPDDVAGFGGVVDEAEDIRTHVIAFDKLMGLVQSGEASCGPLVLSALWLSHNRDRLRAGC